MFKWLRFESSYISSMLCIQKKFVYFFLDSQVTQIPRFESKKKQIKLKIFLSYN